MSSSETFFPINDLLRRKLQTGMVIAGQALCVASTLFVLSLGGRTGFGALAANENKLTAGFAVVFSQFIVLTEILIFLVGIVAISFLMHTMMSQRTKDIGLIKAAGCPSSAVFGYFMNEVIIVTLASCFLGIIIGLVADYVSSSFLFSTGSLGAAWQVNPLAILTTFASYVIISLIVGIRPILAANKVNPAVALSPTFSFGLSKESDFKGAAKAGITTKVAARSLVRRRSTAFQVLLCLTIVFILVTVSVAGGIIANETTANWVERAVGKKTLLIAQSEMATQYEFLLSEFYKGYFQTQFNYTDQRYLASDQLLTNLRQITDVKIDARLVVETQVKEVEGFNFGQETGETTIIGDHRTGNSLIEGVEPASIVTQYIAKGSFLGENQTSVAVIGDTLAADLFSEPLNQSLVLSNRNFQISGVILDPINNGNVTFISLKTLESITGVSKPNVILVQITEQANRTRVLDELLKAVSASDPEFEVLELDPVLNKQLDFSNGLWSEVMLFPILSLAAGTLCMIGYVTMIIEDQRDEYGTLRAIGTGPGKIMKIIMTQSSLVLLSSWAMGLALGIIVAVLILIPEPFFAAITVVEISAWLLTALAVLLISSIYPALRFVRKPPITIMHHQ